RRRRLTPALRGRGRPDHRRLPARGRPHLRRRRLRAAGGRAAAVDGRDAGSAGPVSPGAGHPTRGGQLMATTTTTATTTTPTTATLTIVNPVAEPQAHQPDADRHAPARRVAGLDGKTVALYWNGKQNGLHALARVKENLTKEHHDVRFIEMTGDLGGTNRYLSADQLDRLAADADVAVCTSADCGSCTSWLMRDLCELERRGVPAVGFTAEIFAQDAHFSTQTFGVPEACPVIVPECFSNKTAAEIAQMVDDAMDDVVAGLTVERQLQDDLPQFDRMTLEPAPELVFTGADLMDAFDALQAGFVANGWSDGLPLVPPTHRKVEAMIAASGRDGDDVVGLFAPGFGVGTVRKIAANAVM